MRAQVQPLQDTELFFNAFQGPLATHAESKHGEECEYMIFLKRASDEHGETFLETSQSHITLEPGSS